ncbi:MAG: dihydroneopterin aldolase [bacterium]
MDSIRLENIRVYAYVGITEVEREIGLNILVDVEAFLDLKKAGRTDDPSYTVDYIEVFDHVKDVCTRKRYVLIEGLADSIASEILEAYPKVKKVAVSIKRPHIPHIAFLDYAQVTIEREREKRGR